MQSLKGQLLIATPQLSSPMFSRSVVLMLDHSNEGAMGIIVNQPISTTISDLAGKVFDKDFEWNKPLHLGGPVPGSLLMVHTMRVPGSQEIVPGVFVTLDASSVQELIRERVEPSLVIANYAGWGPGQLEGEFNGDSWITLPATSEYVFWTGEKELWNVVVSQANARKLSDFLGLKPHSVDPTWN